MIGGVLQTGSVGWHAPLLSTTHTHPFIGPFSGTTRVSQYQKGKPISILLKPELHQLDHMQVCTFCLQAAVKLTLNNNTTQLLLLLCPFYGLFFQDNLDKPVPER